MSEQPLIVEGEVYDPFLDSGRMGIWVDRQTGNNVFIEDLLEEDRWVRVTIEVIEAPSS